MSSSKASVLWPSAVQLLPQSMEWTKLIWPILSLPILSQKPLSVQQPIALHSYLAVWLYFARSHTATCSTTIFLRGRTTNYSVTGRGCCIQPFHQMEARELFLVCWAYCLPMEWPSPAGVVDMMRDQHNSHITELSQMSKERPRFQATTQGWPRQDSSDRSHNVDGWDHYDSDFDYNNFRSASILFCWNNNEWTTLYEHQAGQPAKA